jgi:predicted short-subunit dehydrogenase-like oxidoreductase (DUF2520 family)
LRLWLQADAVSAGDILNRSRASSEAAVALIGRGRVAGSLEEMGGADLWLIGTGDGQIADVARQLAAARGDLSGTLAFHLAGRFGLDVLEPLARAGARVAALHPVRSLTNAPVTVADFAGTACVVEGEPAALAGLESLVRAIEGLWLPVQGVNRGLYHAAVSVISNVTKGVAWKAQNWLEHAGLPADTAGTVTYQLLYTTMEDLARVGARNSITGPIVRGDTTTIEAHLEALASFPPNDVEVYRVLIRTVLELAQERGDLDTATLRRFEQLLK